MRLLFQGHRCTRANTNQRLRIKNELSREPFSTASTCDRGLIDMLSVHVPGWEPVEDVRLRNECPSDTCVGVLQRSPSPLLAFGFASLQGPFYALLGFLTYQHYGNEQNIPNVTRGKGNKVNICCNLPLLEILSYSGFWEHSLVDHFLLRGPTGVALCR